MADPIQASIAFQKRFSPAGTRAADEAESAQWQTARNPSASISPPAVLRRPSFGRWHHQALERGPYFSILLSRNDRTRCRGIELQQMHRPDAPRLEIPSHHAR